MLYIKYLIYGYHKSENNNQCLLIHYHNKNITPIITFILQMNNNNNKNPQWDMWDLNFHFILGKKEREREKHLSQQTRKFIKKWEYQTTLLVYWDPYMWVKKQQSASDME